MLKLYGAGTPNLIQIIISVKVTSGRQKRTEFRLHSGSRACAVLRRCEPHRFVTAAADCDRAF
jgi:hypothetical protein